MSLGIFGLGVMEVVGRQQRQAEILGQAQQVLHGLALDVDAVIHDLAVEVLRTEDVSELRRSLDSLAVLPLTQPGLYLTASTTSRADQTLPVGRQQLTIDSWLEVVALHRGQRAHPEEVVHAPRRSGQQCHVGVGART